MAPSVDLLAIERNKEDLDSVPLDLVEYSVQKAEGRKDRVTALPN